VTAADELLVEVEDHVAVVTLNRPARLNALSSGLLDRLVDTFADLDRDGDVRAVCLAASGDRAFSAGADLQEMGARDREGGAPYQPMTGPNRNPYEVVLECRKPTLAVLHGWVVGAGCELALACDLRLAAVGTRLMLPESKVGLGANFGSQMLPRLVPTGFAYEMLYFGEPVDVAVAHRMGLVNWVVPREDLHERARALALTLASRAPVTLRRYKAMVQLGSTLPIAAALRLDSGPSPYLSEDRREGAAAFLEKRPARWTGR
jgi:enoyl-CoA hydratase